MFNINIMLRVYRMYPLRPSMINHHFSDNSNNLPVKCFKQKYKSVNLNRTM